MNRTAGTIQDPNLGAQDVARIPTPSFVIGAKS